MEKLCKENVEVKTIGQVELDKDEMELLKLPPKFAVRKRLDSKSMEIDKEMCMAKLRYQIHKENMIKEIERDENQTTKRLKQTLEEEEDL